MMDRKMKPNKTEEKEASELHDHIESGVIGAVKRFVENNRDVKSSCNSFYESALMTALRTKNYDIFAYLVSQGFTYGENEDFKNIIEKLDKLDKKTLKKSYAEYFQVNESSHILDLMRRSRLHFRSKKSNFHKIQKFYEKLDKIPEMQPLLQVVASAVKLDIVFDFNCASTCDMDPTSFDENIRGVTSIKSGDIRIGAKKKADVLGILAHELTHYAMQLIYENRAKPYSQDDQNQKEKKYNDILKNYMKMKNHEHHINIALQYKNLYLQIVELIVRVPHLIALHSKEPKKLTKLRDRYKDLFDFYYDNVLPDLRTEFPLMKPKRKIQKLNNLLGVYKKFEKASNFTCVTLKLEISEILDESRNICVTTEVPKLVFANLIKHLKLTSKEIDSSFIYIGLDQLMEPRHHPCVNKAFNSIKQPKIFVIYSSEVNESAEEVENFITARLSATRIVLVSDYKLKSLEKFPIQKVIEHEWVDLEETSHNQILNWKIKFQGKNVELSKILRKEFFDQTSLKDILKLKKIKIHVPKNALKRSEIYIKRTFKNKSGLTVTCEKVLENFVNDRVLVIADGAGMGKTTIARYFAKKLPERFKISWVVFIDLKEHTNIYFEDLHEKQPEKPLDFEFLIKFLKIKNLKLKIFQHLYKTENVIFILDGFDEISPKYKECLLKVIAAVRDSKNRLMITTRTHLAEDLEDHLSVKALKFNSLDAKNGKKLLIKLLCKRLKDKTDGAVKEKAKLLYRKFKWSLRYITPFDSPLLVSMISELDEEDLEVFNIYTLFERFVEKKIDIWYEKGPLAIAESKDLQRKITVTQIHHEMALQLLLDDETFKFLKIPKSEIEQEQVTRIGLLYFDGKNFQFVHRSFAEYFLANYLICNLKPGTILTSSDKFTNVLMSIVTSRMFYNEKRFVEAHLKETENSLIGKLTIDFTIKETSDFIRASINGNLNNLLCVVLANLHLDIAQKLELLENPFQYTEGSNNNFFHYWSKMEGNIHTFFVLHDWAKTFVSKEKLIEMFFIEKNVHDETCFYITMVKHRLEEKEWESVLTRVSGSLSNIDFKKLFQEKNKKGWICLYKMPSQLFQLIYNSDDVTLSDRKQFLSEPKWKGLNFLMIALHRKKAKLTDCILNEAKKLFSNEELDEYLSTKSEDNRTCFHMAARRSNWKMFENFLNFCKDSFDESRLKSFLMEKDSSGQIILLYHAKKNRYQNSFIESVLNFYRGLNLITNEEKETLLSQIQLENEKFNKSLEGIDKILKTLKPCLSRKKAKKILDYKLESGETCLLIAAKTANLDQFRLLWSFVEEKFDERGQIYFFEETFRSNRKFNSNNLKNAELLVLEEILNIAKILCPTAYRELSVKIKRFHQYRPILN